MIGIHKYILFHYINYFTRDINYLYQQNMGNQGIRPKLIFGYWGISGRGQPLRFLLAYSGLQWDDKPYKDKDQWFDNDKKNLGLPYPNLPYIIDGDFKLTETQSLWRYIIRRSGKLELLGKDIQDQAEVDTFVSVIADVFTNILGIIFNKNVQTEKDKYFQDKFEALLTKIDKFIKPQQFYLGYLTACDFFLAVNANYLDKIYPNILNRFPNIKSVRDKVFDLPQIKKYFENGITRCFPMNSFVNA